MDGLGAQAREASRTESAAARLPEHHFHPDRKRPPEAIPGVRYVITLDADTRLPRGSVARLVGTMAHPLNQPAFSSAEGRVVDGYGIVQPRITPSLPGDGRDRSFKESFPVPAEWTLTFGGFRRVPGSFPRRFLTPAREFTTSMSSNAALGRQSAARIFCSATICLRASSRARRSPRISSCSTNFPSHYEAAAARQHRWARGDWQLLPWISRELAAAPGRRQKFKIPVVGRWKMLDNLRRTLSAPVHVSTLLAGWVTPGVSPWLWTRFVLATIAIPALLPFLAGVNAHLGGISKRSHFRGLISDFSLGLSQAV